MSASPSETLDPDGYASPADPGHAQVTLMLSLDPHDALVLHQGAAIRCLPISTFIVQEALVEAVRIIEGNPCLMTATTSILVQINEVFDRLAAAMGQSEQTLISLGAFIQDTMPPTCP